MASRSSFLLIFVIISSAVWFSDAGGFVGVNYGRIADDLPSPAQVVELLKSQGLDRVKLYDTDSEVLTALAGTNISVIVAMPNELLSAAAGDQSVADNWVQANISKYYPSTKIEAIAVGNEVFVQNETTPFLVPAMKNVQASLQKYNLDSAIKVSSPIALSSLASSYPSSAGSFRPDLIEPAIKPMLDLLRSTGSYLMVNAYPFFAYEANADTISLGYALFNQNSGVVDSGNGLKYFSLLEAQLDAVYAAMSALKYDDVKIVISETGWPSAGDSNEIGSSAANAASYNGNLVKRVLTGNGSPLRPNDPINVYLFALFNENQKPGPTSERNYGLFYPNQQKVYNIPLTLEELVSGTVIPAANGSKTQVPVSGDVSPAAASGQTWCVANGNLAEEKLQEALNYACGEGGADCRPIQEGATCYDPNTLVSHASYAFNSYYQKNARGVGSCDFEGAAYVVTQPPRFGNCEFPTTGN